MSFIDGVAARLSRPDMLQATVLLFVALGFTLAVGWPTGISLVNEAWFSLAPVRTSALALGALSYGAVLGARSRRGGGTDTATIAPPLHGSAEWRLEAGVTLGALAVLAVVTAPFEIVSHAASFPGTDLLWSVLAPFLVIGGYFGLGLLVGRGAALAHLTALLPLLVPAVLAAAVWLDVSIGRTVINPWSAALAVSPALIAVLGALSLVSLWAVLPLRRPQGTPASGGVGA